MSARQVFTPGQLVIGYGLLTALLGGLAASPITTLIVLNVAMGVFYLGNFLFKGVLVAVGGLVLGWLIYAARAVRGESAGVAALLAHQFYVEDAYNAVVVAPARALARACGMFDRNEIDATVNWVGRETGWAGQALRRLETGYLRQYAAYVMVGVLLILVYWVSR